MAGSVQSDRLMDQVPIERIKEYQNRFTEFLTTSKAAVLDRIGREKALSDPLTAELKAATEQFTKLWA